MIYSSPGPSWFATKLALGSSGAALPVAQPVSAVAAIPETSAARAARSEAQLKALLQPVEATLKRYEDGVVKVERERQEAYGNLTGMIETMREIGRAHV